MISEPMVCPAQTVHLSCVKISTISKQTEMSFRLSLITLEDHWDASKTISEPMVCSAQTVHVPGVNISTILKWTEASFYLSLII
jgi:hypothetical protein